MLRVICCAIVVSVSLGFSHGFNVGDDFPLEIFSNLLSDIPHEHEGHRYKRHPPPDMNCCGEAPSKDDWELVKKCGDFMTKREEPATKEDMANGVSCFAECMMKEKSLFADGVIADKDAYTNYLKDNENDEYRRSQMEKSYDQCVAEAKIFKNKISEVFPNLECDPIAGGFMHCLVRETLINCPADKYKDTKNCHMLKEILQKKIEDM